MAILTVSLASATLAGSLAAGWTWAVLFVTLIAAINYGLLSGLSPNAGWIGQQAATYVIIAGYFPRGLHYAVGRTGMVLAGGALQMLVFTAFYFIKHPAIEAAAPPLPHRLKHRISELWQTLRKGCHFRGDTLSYILRLSITLLLCTAIYRRFHVRNGYWSPMTALLVLKPQWVHTVSRSIARLIGTLLGAGIALLLARFVHFDPAVILACVLVCAWACYAVQAVNYAAFSLFITLYIVFLFRSGGFSQTSAAHIRLFNTALGGCIALLIDALWNLWPTRTPSPTPELNPTPEAACS
jgi:hypothetical protein